MPALETLTEKDIHKYIQAKSLRQARGYVYQVKTPIRIGQTLKAYVPGTRHYEVKIEVSPVNIKARCSCPYDGGGYCKHIGAVLLKWIQAAADFTVEAIAAIANDYPDYPDYPIEITPVDPLPTYRPQESPFWITHPFAVRRQDDLKDLKTWLTRSKLSDLRQMANKQGWSVKGTRKADIIEQIMDRLIDPKNMRQIVAELDEEHKQVLQAIILLGNLENIQPEDLERVAKIWRSLENYQQISSCTRDLCAMGLAIPGNPIDSHSSQADLIPRALVRILPPALAGVVPATADLQADQLANELHFAEPFALVRAASQIAILLEQTPTVLRPPMPRPQLEKLHPGLTEWDYDPQEILQAQQTKKLSAYSDLVLTIPPPDYSLPDEAIKQLAPIASDETRLEFIYALLIGVGYFQPGSPVTIWPQMKEQFLGQTELAHRAILAEVYFRMLHWNELWAILRNQEATALSQRLTLKRSWLNQYAKPDHLYLDLWRFRQLVLRVLASLPDEQWIMLEDLFSLMRQIWPKFDAMVWQSNTPAYQHQRHHRRKPDWFLAKGKSEKPLSTTDAQTWQLAQGAFIRYMLTGPLHWLGLTDLSFTEGVLTAVRFHSLADLYWDRVEVPPAPKQATINRIDRIDKPNKSAPDVIALTIDGLSISVIPSAISAQAHNLLDRIARLAVTTSERFVYQLDPQAAHESFEAGVTLSEIASNWEEIFPYPIPETIQATIKQWWQAYGQVRIYEDVTIIEFGDDYALTEMKAITSLEKYLIAEISPRLALIDKRALLPLTTELEKAGYTPKQTDQV